VNNYYTYIIIIHLLVCEDVTDRVFRNVGI